VHDVDPLKPEGAEGGGHRRGQPEQGDHGVFPKEALERAQGCLSWTVMP
jgi:hypothetical protein